jgi:hypothetical protein
MRLLKMLRRVPVPLPEYPDLEAGLKLLPENIFAAVTVGDKDKMSSYLLAHRPLSSAGFTW